MIAPANRTWRLAELRDHVREHAENRPGVYWMVGENDEVLYVGKSIRIRTRLLSYFRADASKKASRILGHTRAVRWEYVPSEFAALLRELRLIKQWRPSYNVEHKRKAAHCFVKLTRHAAPRLLVTSRVKDDDAFYWGPFQGSRRVRRAVRAIVNALELRDCPRATPMSFADQAELFDKGRTALCIRSELARCAAPCAAGCTAAEYRSLVQDAHEFMNGEGDRPLAILRDRLESAVERLQFEYAARLHERVEALQRLRADLAALRGTVSRLSIAYLVPGRMGGDRVYVIRRGSVLAEMAAPQTNTDRKRLAMLASEALSDARDLGRSYASATAGVRTPAGVAEVLLVTRWFRRRPDEMRRAIPLEHVLNGTAEFPCGRQ